MKIRPHVEKLRGLPDHTKKTIMWTVVIIFALAMGFFWFRGAMNNFSKMSESIKLPAVSLPTTDILQTTSPSDGNAITASTSTADWQTYTNDKYAYQISYPSDWIVDVNLMSENNFGEGDSVFCPPELQEVNSVTGNNQCQVGKTNGGSIDPKAPISLFQCDTQGKTDLTSCKAYKGANLGIDQAGRYFYKLVLIDQKYLGIYNQMISTFKFTN